jgi:hypothetical protein
MTSRAIQSMILMGQQPPAKRKHNKMKQPQWTPSKNKPKPLIVTEDPLPIPISEPLPIPVSVPHCDPMIKAGQKKKKSGPKNPLKKPMLNRAAPKKRKNLSQNSPSDIVVLSKQCGRKTNVLCSTDPMYATDIIRTATNHTIDANIILNDYVFGSRIKHVTGALPFSIDHAQFDHYDVISDNTNTCNLFSQPNKYTKPLIVINAESLIEDSHSEHITILQRSKIHAKPLILQEHRSDDAFDTLVMHENMDRLLQRSNIHAKPLILQEHRSDDAFDTLVMHENMDRLLQRSKIHAKPLILHEHRADEAIDTLVMHENMDRLLQRSNIHAKPLILHEHRADESIDTLVTHEHGDRLLQRSKLHAKPLISQEYGFDYAISDNVTHEHGDRLLQRSKLHAKPLISQEYGFDYAISDNVTHEHGDRLLQRSKLHAKPLISQEYGLDYAISDNVTHEHGGHVLHRSKLHAKPLILQEHNFDEAMDTFACTNYESQSDRILKNNTRITNISKPLVSVTHAKPSTPAKCILFTNVRDEARIVEWIAHHQNIGFDHIHIFDHLSKVPVKSMVEHIPNLSVERMNITLKEGVHLKLHFMRIALAKAVQYDWMLYLDADEFLAFPKYHSIQDFLAAYPSVHQIGINWLCFGSNYLDTLDGGTILEKFTKSDKCLNEHIKCFVRPSYVANPYNPHVYSMKKRSVSCAIDYRRLHVHQPYFFPWAEDAFADVTVADAYVAHYSHQDYATYIKRKCDLPRDDTGEMREILSRAEIHAKHNTIDNYVLRDLYNQRNKELMVQWDRMIIVGTMDCILSGIGL